MHARHTEVLLRLGGSPYLRGKPGALIHAPDKPLHTRRQTPELTIFKFSTSPQDMASTTPCWSCRKRRVCCDLERPSCRKCTVKGIECPGYDAKRPRRWTQYVPPEDLPRAVSEPHASNKQEQLKTTLGLRQPPFCAQQDDVAPPVVVLDALAYCMCPSRRPR